MTWPCSVKNTIKKRNAKQRVGGAAIRLRSADQARQHSIELRLLGKDPAGKAPDIWRWRPARHTERLCQGGIDRGEKEQNEDRQQNASRKAGSRHQRQGQVTTSLFANCAPQAMVVFF